MALYRYRAVGNGLGTDHPIPDLPFVDDAHIPLDDPAAIEAVGRDRAEDMWGREDALRGGNGWVAFTTDPYRHDLAWCVRWHPEHGRSVVVYRDEDVSSVHTVLCWELGGTALLFRSGGYWWDGTAWYRPAQIWDGAREEYVRRPVQAAVTTNAADLLGDGPDPARGRIRKINEIDVDGAAPTNWLDELALWAQHRHPAQRPLSQCVVNLSAAELTGDQLVGIAEMADLAGIAASTLRAYISRGEDEVPLPQATVSGRSMWARTVASEWAEQRRRSHENVTAAVSTDHNGSTQPIGIAEIWNRFTDNFFSLLWERPTVRRRWALRWRNKDAVRELAENLAWTVAASTDRIVPTGPLAATIRHAVLDEFATGQELHRATFDGEDSDTFYGITWQVGQMLGWLVRHFPTTAGATINEIIGEAERRLNIPREVSQQSLKTSLSLDGKLDSDLQTDFLSRVLAPNDQGESERSTS